MIKSISRSLIDGIHIRLINYIRPIRDVINNAAIIKYGRACKISHKPFDKKSFTIRTLACS